MIILIHSSCSVRCWWSRFFSNKKTAHSDQSMNLRCQIEVLVVWLIQFIPFIFIPFIFKRLTLSELTAPADTRHPNVLNFQKSRSTNRFDSKRTSWHHRCSRKQVSLAIAIRYSGKLFQIGLVAWKSDSQNLKILKTNNRDKLLDILQPKAESEVPSESLVFKLKGRSHKLASQSEQHVKASDKFKNDIDRFDSIWINRLGFVDSVITHTHTTLWLNLICRQRVCVLPTV